MALELGVVEKTISINTANQYLNMPSTKGMNYDGDWFVYEPVNANNTTYGARIAVFKWDSPAPTNLGNNRLVMEGTAAMITEPWNSADVRYHGIANEHIGPGTNDITNAVEDDAYFFGHLGSLSPATDDDAFYWDRAFLPTGLSDWQYYQYHKHLPTSYVQYENGRMTHGAGFYINPEDKSFGWMIHTIARVSNVNYQTVLARVHTPSVGGAHNSHNDVTLPTVSNRNYMAGGLLKGAGSRFHAFYISAGTANNQLWSVFTRTFVDTSSSFTAQVDLGEFDLADPTLNLVSQQCHSYPVRVSAGDLLGTRIHFPVIINGTTANTFTLQDWSFTSADTLGGGSLIRTNLITNQNTRPDCHMVTVGTTLYALSTDAANGGVRLFEYDVSGGWAANSIQVVTNANTNFTRVHSFKYNTQDVKFYTLLSGNTSNTGTYTGAGLYTFTLGGEFDGYEHLDFDSANNSFVIRGPSSNGYLAFTVTDSTIARSNNKEPQGISTSQRILEYTPTKPKFFNETEIDLGAGEIYYQGIVLDDGSARKLLGGKIENLSYGQNEFDDFLISLVSQDNEKKYHFAWGGDDSDDVVNVNGDDYVTGMYQSKIDPDKVWLTGYTKSELVSKRDMKIHGYCRNLKDPPNLIEWDDLVTDNIGDIYLTGKNNDGYGIFAKYNSNYVLQWQKQIGSDDVVSAQSITIDNDNNLYIVGSADSNTAIFKISSNGSAIWSKTYGTSANNDVGLGIAVVNKSNTEYIVASSVEGTNTVFLVLNTDGDIVEENRVTDLIAKRVRNHKSTTDGKFLFSGTNGAGTIGKFGMGLIQASNTMVQWMSTYANSAHDIAVIDSGATPGYVVCGNTSTSGVVLKVTTSGTEGNYSILYSWATKLANSEFYGLTTTDLSETDRFVYVVGKTPTGGTAAMGMDEGIIVKFNNTGTLLWQNVFGHDMDEQLNSVVMDITGDNIISCGWSESHSDARDAILFRSEILGFGTGVYHIAGNAGVPYYYLLSTLTTSPDSQIFTVTNSGTSDYLINGANDPTLTLLRGVTYQFNINASGHPFWIQTVPSPYSAGNTYNTGVSNNGTAVGTITFTVPQNAPNTLYYVCQVHPSMTGTINIVDVGSETGVLSSLTPPSNIDPNFINSDVLEFLFSDTFSTSQIFDGSYGANGTFMMWFGYLRLSLIQEYLNSQEYRDNQDAGRLVNYTKSIFKFYQLSTVGDGSADDGNIFGYDIIEATDGTVWMVGQTSGDLEQVNQGTSGVYDYILIRFDPTTEEMEVYQNGTSLDEEIYSLCELSDGRIAFVGRTTGDLTGGGPSGDTPQSGGYDIFLGIFDPDTEVFDYYNIGTGLDDRGINLHDYHDFEANTLVVVYSTYGALGNNTVGVGSEDVGVVKFNYVTDEWSANAYQTGTTSSDFFDQNGKHSALLDDGRIAITFSTGGVFAEDQISYGSLDIALAVLDLSTGEFTKAQVGSLSSEIAHSVYSTGERLLIVGQKTETFGQGGQGIFVEADIQYGIDGKSSTES